MASSSALKFTARRKPAVLLAPAAPTPRELKPLSDIDDQESLRFHMTSIYFFQGRPGGGDPVPVLRDAIAAALVHYYPLAGRLTELEGRKLAVDCTGEGVLFVEADADGVRFDQFGAAPQPPFPCVDQFLVDLPAFDVLIGSPVLHIQVTRLACGGFVVASKLHHTVADAQGTVQFLEAVGELARGAAAPTVRPVWGRELLTAPCNDLPPVGFSHREYDDVPAATEGIIPPCDENDMVHRSFFFGPTEAAAARSHLPPALRRRASTFDVLMGCVFRCRTAALALRDSDEFRLLFTCNVRGKKKQGGGGDPFIPAGYYGNGFAFPVAVATAGDLRAKPLSYAVELLREAKREVCPEYMQSVAELMARRGRPHFAVARAYLVSDVSKAGFTGIDFGWGNPLYGGPMQGSRCDTPILATFLNNAKNSLGEKGILVPLCLPGPAMDKFVEEMRKLLRPATNTVEESNKMFAMIRAAL